MSVIDFRFNQIWILATEFRKNNQILNFVKIRPVESELFHTEAWWTDGPTDVTNVIVAFSNYSNIRNKDVLWTDHQTIEAEAVQQSAHPLDSWLMTRIAKRCSDRSVNWKTGWNSFVGPTAQSGCRFWPVTLWRISVPLSNHIVRCNN